MIVNKGLIKLFAVGIFVLLAFNCCHAGGDVSVGGNRSKRSARLLIVELYKEFSWGKQGELEGGRKTLGESSQFFLEKFFSKNLAELIRKDAECTKKSQQVCRLNFDPIFASQDPAAENLIISELDEKNEIHVLFRFPGDDSIIRIRYRLKNNKTWKIEDICYSDGSCLGDMLMGEDL